jgi:hypothetical protein
MSLGRLPQELPPEDLANVMRGTALGLMQQLSLEVAHSSPSAAATSRTRAGAHARNITSFMLRQLRLQACALLKTVKTDQV